MVPQLSWERATESAARAAAERGSYVEESRGTTAGGVGESGGSRHRKTEDQHNKKGATVQTAAQHARWSQGGGSVQHEEAGTTTGLVAAAGAQWARRSTSPAGSHQGFFGTRMRPRP